MSIAPDQVDLINNPVLEDHEDRITDLENGSIGTASLVWNNESNGVQVTASVGWTNAVTFNVNLPVGDFIIIASFEINNVLGNPAKGRVIFPLTNVIQEAGTELPVSAGQAWTSAAGNARVSIGTAGTFPVAFDFRSSPAGGNARIRNKRVSIFKVDIQ